MKEHPILFSAPMVRAILEGRKTMTRRVCKTQPIAGNVYATKDEGVYGAQTERSVVRYFSCPYGQPGDRLWVRETFGDKIVGIGDGDPIFKTAYRADGEIERSVAFGGWTPSIFMHRFQSRILLEVLSVRVERVRDISEADAVAEGMSSNPMRLFHEGIMPHSIDFRIPMPIQRFIGTWNAINYKRGFGWYENPWAWVIEFKRVEP